MAVVDYQGTNELSAEEIVQLEPLFRIWVVDRAIKSGRWPVIGHVELPAAELQPVKFYKQDTLHWELLFFKWSDGLEKAAHWGPEHVEDRILDHFAGRPNRWLKSISLRQ